MTTHRQALERIRELAAKSSRQDAYATLHMIMASVDAALEAPPVPDNRPELTARQAEVLSYIETYRVAHGYSPAFREIAEHFGVTINAVAGYLKVLERKGYVRRHRYHSRALTVVGGGR